MHRDEERDCSVKKCAAATKVDAAERKTHCLKTKCDAAGDMVTSVGDEHGHCRWRAPRSKSKVQTDQAGGVGRVTRGKPPVSEEG
jgi:hypothetical protein